MTAADAMMTGLSTDGLSTDGLSRPDSVNVHTALAGFDEKIKAALKNPKLLIYKLQSSAYKFARALIPMSLPFMWLIFAWRRDYKLYDHAIFVTYSLSFVMVLLVAMALVASLGVPTGWVLWLVPVHMFRRLRQAYRPGWFGCVVADSGVVDCLVDCVAPFRRRAGCTWATGLIDCRVPGNGCCRAVARRQHPILFNRYGKNQTP